MRYITLKTEELEALELLYKNSTDNMVRKRSQCLLLSHQKQTITDLSKIFSTSRRTIERWFDGWAQSGVESLQMAPGRGVKTRLKGYEDEVAEQVEIHGRNLKNVLNYFEEKHKISICKKTLQNFLKGTGLYLEANQAIPKDKTEPG
jgi:transposase